MAMGSSNGYGVPGRGRGGLGRWVALGLGLVVLIGVFVLQRHGRGPGAAMSTSVSATPSVSVDRATSGVTSSAGSRLATTAGLTGADTGALSSTGFSSGPAVSSATSSALIAAVPQGLLPGATDWELLGYGTSSVVVYRPGTGRVVVTPVSGVASSGPLFFIATATSVIIRPLDFVTGYAVPDGKPAAALTGLLAQGGPAFPGPDADHLWIATGSGVNTSFILVDAAGRSANLKITLPPRLQSSWPQPDGAGHLLVTGIGGTYLARPDGLQLVTNGTVMAAGPTAFLVYECDQHATCSAQAIDRQTAKRTAIPYLPAPPPFQESGPISADGRYAAILEAIGAPTASSFRPHLVNLVTGQDRTVILDVDTSATPSSTMAFSPDGHYLLIDTSGGQIVAVNTETGHLTRLPAPIPPVTAIAVRPTH